MWVLLFVIINLSLCRKAAICTWLIEVRIFGCLVPASANDFSLFPPTGPCICNELSRVFACNVFHVFVMKFLVYLHVYVMYFHLHICNELFRVYTQATHISQSCSYLFMILTFLSPMEVITSDAQ